MKSLFSITADEMNAVAALSQLQITYFECLEQKIKECAEKGEFKTTYIYPKAVTKETQDDILRILNKKGFQASWGNNCMIEVSWFLK